MVSHFHTMHLCYENVSDAVDQMCKASANNTNSLMQQQALVESGFGFFE